MDWAQTASIVAALGAFTGMQAFWIARALDRVHAALDRLDVRLDRVDARLADLEGHVFRDHGERIARLEQRGAA